ncbi:MAG: DsbC family protein [Candidatus Parabeggiatoa sp. nov. 3]|nr:MAG: DsbC family protein [Gammaproteobacteria bacterium]RKZ67874.1 MAG: DsbC family protein [Gammaproteobacteria bacterium]RKZ81537.1 MAG: DsbC family protein [Gammaproteobacteria bacterium]
MRISMILALLALSSSAFAADTPTSKAQQQVPSAVTATAKKMFGEEASKKVARSPVAGLYEVIVGNGDVLYISLNGRHIIAGNIFSRNGKNLTKKRQNELRQEDNPRRQKAINAVDETEMVVFAPKGETKYTVNVFTDVDCGYCAKFHQERQKLNEGGVKVRYLAFPRAGVDSTTYKKMVSIWCASDQQKAMTDAKERKSLGWVSCSIKSKKNSRKNIKAQLELGQSIGVSGTPAMVLEDGELMPGYVPADKLIPFLEEKFGK